MNEKIKKVSETFHTYSFNYRYIIDKRFRENGLYYGQPPILKYLSENKNATQKEIADFLHISPPSVATSVKRMEEAGLIMKVADKKDARCNNLKLTKKGKALSEFADSCFDDADEAAFAGFTDADFETLYTLLSRMNDNLKVLNEKE